jgi:mannitol operon transcriptional antiterminator
MTAPHLDTRDIRILRWLLDQTEPRSTAAVAADLGLSQRVIRYRLGAVDSFLRTRDLEVLRRRGAGVWIDAPADQRAALGAELTGLSEAPRVYAREERDHILVASILWAAPEATSLDFLHDVLEVSKASARRDLRRNETWLDQRGLALMRRPGVGISVVGPEARVRRALVQLTMEAAPEEVLAELCARPFEEARLVRVRVPFGVRDHLSRLPIHSSARLVANSVLGGTLSDGNNELVFAIYVAVTAARISDGKLITMGPGHHRSLTDHPVSETVASIAASYERAFGLPLPDLEVAGITEYLLGLATLGSMQPIDHIDHNELLDLMMNLAAVRLQESLGTDTDLRNNLAQHLDRLAVRLRYGLPVHNPLLHEVAERYPIVHAVAGELGALISKYLEAPVAEDEVGFVTMYLCGAIERSRLHPAKRAIVVCPSGMATAWVLVSRIQTEFPQLGLVKVLSSRSYLSLGAQEADLVISTVEIPEGDIPVVIVNPLLPPGDVRRLAAYT